MVKKVSVRDIAKITKVSRMTVSRVINGDKRVKDETRQRILKTIKKLNYDPSQNIPYLQKIKKDTRTIGLVSPTTTLTKHDYFLSQAFMEFKDNAGQRGYNCVLYNNHDIAAIVNQDFHVGRKNMIADGLIFFCPVLNWEDNVRQLHRWGLPLVLVRRTTDLAGIPVITNDDHNVIQAALEHFYRLGHRRIALTGQRIFFVSETPQQGRAYSAFLEAKGLSFDERLVFDTDDKGTTGFEDWVEGLVTAGEEGASALLCLDDIYAVSAIASLQNRGHRVPADLAVIGYNNTPVTELVRPAITSVNIPVKEMLELAVKLLDNLMDGTRIDPLSYELKCDLVIRGSCGYKQGILPTRASGQRQNKIT